MSNQNAAKTPIQSRLTAAIFPLLSVKKNLVPGIIAICLLTGCSTTYMIRLTNSDTLTAKTRPRLDGHGYYVFKDADGKDVRINELRVREIETK